jgi:hypothetical protein
MTDPTLDEAYEQDADLTAGMLALLRMKERDA